MMTESRKAARMLVCFGFILLIRAEFLSPRHKEQEKTTVQGFIRMDLLPLEASPMPPPLRNIFVPLRSGMTARLQPIPGEGDLPGDPLFPQAGVRPAVRIESSRPGVRYVGYIDSGRRIVGLILFQGEALAVVGGEFLTETVRVGNITPESIEIIDRDSEPKIYPLEGETP